MHPPVPRLKPQPIPQIHPVPDYLADAALSRVYEDTRQVLQVPWMGVVTMAFAHYPIFYDTLWRGLRPLAASRAFVESCATLRKAAEGAVRGLGPADLTAALSAEGYAPREIAEIRALIEIFSHGNMPYVLIATLARLLLEGEALSEDRSVESCARRHGPAGVQRLILIEPHHADAPTRQVYADIRQTLGLPFVNTDYRALARWPSYFARAWAGLKPLIEGAGYAPAVQRVHDAAVTLARGLPNPGGLTPQMLTQAAGRDAARDEILAVVRLFQWLLPGLAVNVAVFRAQLMQSEIGSPKG